MLFGLIAEAYFNVLAVYKRCKISQKGEVEISC